MELPKVPFLVPYYLIHYRKYFAKVSDKLLYNILYIISSLFRREAGIAHSHAYRNN